MSGIFDRERVDFICPNCNKKIVKTVGQLRQSFCRCPQCNMRIENRQFNRDLQNVDKQIKDLQRSIKNIKLKF